MSTLAGPHSLRSKKSLEEGFQDVLVVAKILWDNQYLHLMGATFSSGSCSNPNTFSIQPVECNRANPCVFRSSDAIDRFARGRTIESSDSSSR